MAGAVLARTRRRHDAEDRVARTERYRHQPLAHESGAHEAARVVAGPDDDPRRRQVVAFGPVGRERAGDAPRILDRRQLRLEALRRGAQGVRRPALLREVHQVHARSIARIDRRVFAREQRRQPRADEVDAVGRCVPVGIFPRELADLRTGEALEGARSGQHRQRTRSAERGFDRAAVEARARVHPDRRRPSREQSRQSARPAAGPARGCRAGCARSALTYTLPCCCADPEMARSALQSTSASRDQLADHRDRARATHISGGACTIVGSARAARRGACRTPASPRRSGTIARTGSSAVRHHPPRWRSR